MQESHFLVALVDNLTDLLDNLDALVDSLDAFPSLPNANVSGNPDESTHH